ncbi:helix-turn-helix domain-containing protein [Streptomyces sp. NPDC051577]|uniref:helix-turn-helix domain-containing protein n=1 Tax=Streptomyces sp. NPDC051577 TaxID=3155166 RepID=UPI00343E1EA7
MGANQHSNPFTPEDCDELRRLHAEGHGRNEIARRMGRGPRTISVYASQMHLLFDRAETEEATRVRKIDLEEKRVILAEALTDDAMRLSAAVWEPTKVHNFGGRDNVFRDADVPEPPAADKRALMAAAATANQQALRLVPPETDTEGLAAVDAWLKGMMGGPADPA